MNPNKRQVVVSATAAAVAFVVAGAAPQDFGGLHVNGLPEYLKHLNLLLP